MIDNKEPLFDMGRVVATRPVSERMEEDKNFEQTVMKCLLRHATGDFGVTPEEDKRANMEELNSGVLEHGGGRILSRYHTDGTTEAEEGFREGDIYIQTMKEGETLYTCVLYCEEY